jgi:hypothetical protein
MTNHVEQYAALGDTVNAAKRNLVKARRQTQKMLAEATKAVASAETAQKRHERRVLRSKKR